MVPTTGGREKSRLQAFALVCIFLLGGSPDRPEAISWLPQPSTIVAPSLVSRCRPGSKPEPWMNHRTPSMDEQKTGSSRKESRHVDTFRFTLRTSPPGTLNNYNISIKLCIYIYMHVSYNQKKTCQKTCWLQVPPLKLLCSTTVTGEVFSSPTDQGSKKMRCTNVDI